MINNNKKKVDVGFFPEESDSDIGLIAYSNTHTMAVTLGPIKPTHWEQGPCGRLGN